MHGITVFSDRGFFLHQGLFNNNQRFDAILQPRHSGVRLLVWSRLQTSLFRIRKKEGFSSCLVLSSDQAYWSRWLSLKLYQSFAIGYYRKYHNITQCSLFVTQKFCISIVFSFSWGHFYSKEKMKTVYYARANFGGGTSKEHYGMLWCLLQWSIMTASWNYLLLHECAPWLLRQVRSVKRRATAVLSWLDCSLTAAQHQQDLVSGVEFNSVEQNGCCRKPITKIKKQFSKL